MANDQDRQLERLTGEIRAAGVPPERDLWPEIDAAIDRQDGAPRPRKDRWFQRTRIRNLAAAAVLLLLVAAGWIGAPHLQDEVQERGGALEDIDRALAELTAALETDPDNSNLSRLVLMVHQSRGELLRKTIQNNVHNRTRSG